MKLSLHPRMNGDHGSQLTEPARGAECVLSRRTGGPSSWLTRTAASLLTALSLVGGSGGGCVEAVGADLCADTPATGLEEAEKGHVNTEESDGAIWAQARMLGMRWECSQEGAYNKLHFKFGERKKRLGESALSKQKYELAIKNFNDAHVFYIAAVTSDPTSPRSLRPKALPFTANLRR
jgi:hypothetical protein